MSADRAENGVAFVATPVRRSREQVESQIREAILDGVFARGERLPGEATLAEQLQVSQSTVRDALRALAVDGLVTRVPGSAGGSFVNRLDHRVLGFNLGASLKAVMRIGSLTNAEVTRVRRLLEVPAAGLAARHRDDEDLAGLRSLIARESETTFDDPAVAALDRAFHTAVAEASRNRFLAALVDAVHQVARPVAALRLSAEAGRIAVGHHVALVSAIEARRPEVAEDVMARHLNYLADLAQARPNEPASPKAFS